MARARQDATQSMPEYVPIASRIDRVDAVLVSLGDAAKRVGRQTSNGDPNRQVWLVKVQGDVLFEGMSAPDTGRAIYEAKAHQFAYDSTTGEQVIGSYGKASLVGVTPPAPTAAPTR